ncbi:MAG TPA: CPBP family intramembrane glutamic endopeptidase [Rhodocyclaceae bacterium]
MTTPLVIVCLTELLFVVATRLVLHYYAWTSFEAEAIRTVLRIATVSIYWWLLRPLILSRSGSPATLAKPPAIVGLLLFLSIPVLIGNYALAKPIAIFFAVASIAVAVKEEFLFRGILQNLLAQRFGSAKAVLGTSAIFTAWHIGVWEPTVWVFGQIFFASILLGVVYIQSGSIAAAIVIHTTYDALFSLSPLVAAPLNENWGFVPLLASLALVLFWASNGTPRSPGQIVSPSLNAAAEGDSKP